MKVDYEIWKRLNQVFIRLNTAELAQIGLAIKADARLTLECLDIHIRDTRKCPHGFFITPGRSKSSSYCTNDDCRAKE